MRLLIHAGHFKTGTTAFQHALRVHRDLLGARGILVPHMPDGNHGYVLNPLHPVRFDKRMHALSDELARAEARGVNWAVVSAEVLSHLPAEALSQIQQRLQRWPIDVLLVIRPWDTALIARYAQNIWAGDAIGFPDWVQEINRGAFGHPDADYALVMQRLAVSLGPLHVRPYGADAAWNAMFEIIGQNAPSIDAMPETGMLSNRRLAWPDRELLRWANAVLGAQVMRPPAAKHAQARYPQSRPEPLLARERIDSLEERVPELVRAAKEHLKRNATSCDWWPEVRETVAALDEQMRAMLDSHAHITGRLPSAAEVQRNAAPEVIVHDATWAHPLLTSLSHHLVNE